ncbi:bestrophin-2-like isoform X2 [Penaeus chinensis]|uniref:bestrophin-2-like isoform X2 n=1 Tax=Penaeus chinensis TaxID=139456 RepID=UPI001FB699A7|nr:bestrophin-2-like isoform X2 [Penaeus chinensis]
MTVTYTRHVATCRGFGCFWKLLLRWKGSIYKLIWPELILYTILYYTASFIYRFALDDFHKRKFEKLTIHCQRFVDLIPVSFVLGFYVNIVIQRWWDQYKTIPWPDSLCVFASTCIHGHDKRSKLMRRTILRYANLSMLITFTMISPAVKKRFPTREHLVETGFMTENEKKIFDDLDEKASHPKYWMPLVWAGSVVARARKEGRIRDDFAVKTLVDEINSLRGKCGRLLSYDTISIPLVYTQVVTLAVYSFCLGTVMGRQFLDPKLQIPDHDIDFYVPVFTYLQFFFYMGWLKVAETLVNPFGEDDDDFEINWLVDRNLQVSYLIVDEMHNEHPDLIQDMYWDEIFPQELPYTVAAEQYRKEAPQGSTFHIQVPDEEQDFLPLVEEEEDGEDDESLRDEEKGQSPTKKPSSAKSIRSRVGSGLSSRKPSMLSMLLQRVRSGSQENTRRRSTKGFGSTVSIRQMKRRPSQLRSVSRMSSSTQMTLQSSASPTRKITLVGENGTNLNLSDDSLNVQSPLPMRDDSDDEGAIEINFKRRDENAHRKYSGDGITSLKSRPSSSAAGPKIVPLEEPDSQVFMGDDELKTITDDILKTVEDDDSEDKDKPPDPAPKKSFDAVALAGLEPIAEEKKDAEGDSVTDTLDTDRQ